LGQICSELRKVLRPVVRLFRPEPDKFLRHVNGVVHIGANEGQERDQYENLGLDVVWVEAIPDVFLTLKQNIADKPRQKAFQYLLTDKEGGEYEFNISSNAGASSSILEFGLHKDVWPDVTYVAKIKLISSTFAKMVEREEIDINRYQALIIDTQGSELLVLKGAGELLRKFEYIKTEVADFESYVGCCTLSDLTSFLGTFGFREIRRTRFAKRAAGGNYYDVLFRRG
jgi:methyltransferase, FkbM family